MSHTSDWLTKNLETILEGGKVSLDTDDRQHDWLYNTVHTMYQKDMITEEPECFFNLLHDHNHPTLSVEKISKFKGDTSLHAISFRMSEQHEKYAGLLDSQKGFYLAGLRQHDNWPDHKPIIVPALGDIRVLSQMHDTLLYRLENAEEHAHIQETKKPVEVKRPIYIDNSEGLWTSYLNKAFTPDELKLITGNGVHITTSDDELKTRIEKSLSNIPDKPDEHAPEGAVILFNTSNNKKIHELRAIFDLVGVKATVIPFGLSGVRAKEAEEVSHTYSGNNAEKLNHAVDAIQAIDIDDLKKNLARFGVDTAHAYILSEDRGLAVLEDLLSGPEFDGYQERINPYRPQPGVELAHLLKGMSIKEFYEKLKVSAERKGLGDQGIEVQDIVSYQLRPLDEHENKPSINAFGITRNILDFDLYEDKSRAVYSEDYVREFGAPKGQPNSSIPDYIEKHSAVAKAVQALVSAAGFKADLNMSREANQNFDTENNDDFRVVTQSSAIAKIGHSGVKGRGNKHLCHNFDVVSTATKYDFTGQPEVFTLDRIIDNVPVGKDTYQSSLNKFFTLLNDGDAFMLGGTKINKRKFDQDELTVHEMFQFFSLVVGKQVFDPIICKKPFIVTEQYWPKSLEIYMDLHKQGLIGDKPEHIFKQVDSNEEAENALAFARTQYVKLTPPQAAMQKEGKEKDNFFNVAVYCSATSTNPQKCENAYAFAYSLAKNGMGVVNGGGSEGLMKEVSQAVLNFRKEQKKGKEDITVKTFLKCIQCEETFRAEGKFEGADYSIVMPNIYLRMEELQKVDAEVVLSGGAGTVQEILGSVINRLNNRAAIQNRPLIIVNDPADETHVNERVYDVVVKHLPESIMTRANIVVVDTAEEAMDILKETSLKRGFKPPSNGENMSDTKWNIA